MRGGGGGDRGYVETPILDFFSIIGLVYVNILENTEKWILT